MKEYRTKEEQVIDEQIGKRISARCKALKITSKQLGKQIDLSKSTVDDYRSGRTKISANKINDICKVLQCDANYLINGNEDIMRLTGLDDDARRRFTNIDEWGMFLKQRNESSKAYSARLEQIRMELGEALSWLINHGLLEIIANARATQDIWENGKNNISGITFAEVARNMMLFETDSKCDDFINCDSLQTQEECYAETLREEKALSMLLERYVSKSADNTERK